MMRSVRIELSPFRIIAALSLGLTVMVSSTAARAEPTEATQDASDKPAAEVPSQPAAEPQGTNETGGEAAEAAAAPNPPDTEPPVAIEASGDAPGPTAAPQEATPTSVKTNSGKPEATPTAAADAPMAEQKGVEIKDLFTLMAMEVSLASKQQESIAEAPSTITAYGKRDIDSLGYYTLADLADITPGYGTYGIYGERVLETRGQKSGSWNNNRHLLFIDGIPVNAARNYKAHIEDEVPLLGMERVEFLTGPASALYGVSAFFGAINVVPLRLKADSTEVESRFDLGVDRTGKTSKRWMAAASHRGAFGRSNVHFGYFNRNASKAHVGLFNDRANRFFDDADYLFGFASHMVEDGPLRGLGAGIIYIGRTTGLGEMWMGGDYTHEANSVSFETVCPYLKLDREITDTVKIAGYFKYNRGTEDSELILSGRDQVEKWAPDPTNEGSYWIYQTYEARFQSLEGLAEAHWQMFDWLSIIGGVNLDHRMELPSGQSSYTSIYGYPGGDPYRTGNRSIKDSLIVASMFLQARLEYPLLSGINATVGLRGDLGIVGNASYRQLSPRVAVVQRFTDWLAVKAIWSTALQGPDFQALGNNTRAIANLTEYGQDASMYQNLSPESFNSFELGTVVSREDLFASVTGFFNLTNNFIGSKEYPEMTGNQRINGYTNVPGDISAVGVDLGARYLVNQYFDVAANFAVAKADYHGESGAEPENDIAEWRLNLLANGRYEVAMFKLEGAMVFRLVGPYRIGATTAEGLSDRIEAARAHYGALSTVAPFTNPAPLALLDINLTAIAYDYVIVGASVRNLADVGYKYPKSGLPDMPAPGRIFYFSLGLKV